MLRRLPAVNIAGYLRIGWSHISGRSQPAPETAAELMKAMTDFWARVRAKPAPGDMRWNWSH
jgi:hypothetical protein